MRYSVVEISSVTITFMLGSTGDGFKNGTGPASPTGSTGNQHQIRCGYYKKPKITKNTVNSKNRPVQPENRKNRRLNRLMPGLRFVDFSPKTTSFWSLKTNPKPNMITLSSLTPHSPHSLTQLSSSISSPKLPLPHSVFCLTPHGLTSLWLSASRRHHLSSALC